MSELIDIQLCCASCGDGFVFSAGEQELFRLRGLSVQPQQCPSCARGRGQAIISSGNKGDGSAN
jgi:hypothetical protein